MNNKTIVEREKLTGIVVEMDKKMLSGEEINLQIRNELAARMRELQRDIPFNYNVNDEVVVKLDRPIKGRVVDLLEIENKSVLIKPIDRVYKEEFIVPESMLKPWQEKEV